MATHRFRRITLGLLVLVAGVLLCVSLATFDRHEGPFPDYPPTQGAYANLCGADFSMADLLQATLHRVDDRGARWKGSRRKKAEYTNKELAKAEDFKPSPVEGLRSGGGTSRKDDQK